MWFENVFWIKLSGAHLLALLYHNKQFVSHLRLGAYIKPVICESIWIRCETETGKKNLAILQSENWHCNEVLQEERYNAQLIRWQEIQVNLQNWFNILHLN